MLTLTINGRETDFQPGQTLLELTARKETVPSPCGGRGSCGKCTVMVDGRRVLACQTKAEPGMRVKTLGQGEIIVEKNAALENTVDITWNGDPEALGVACDIGTTTVVCHLIRLKTGERLTSMGQANTQSVFGADVISRIQASVDGSLDSLKAAIIGQINAMTDKLCVAAEEPKSKIQYMAVAGNTVMCHLFAGLSPAGIGVAPFTPLSLFGDEYEAKVLGLDFPGKVYITPSVAGYVGGDITADILACDMADTHKPELLIDVGTNGEMAISVSGQIFCCATAAGPAFEGAEISCGVMAQKGAISAVSEKNGVLTVETIGGEAPIGICGSGLIDAVAAMLDLGAVDETGRILDDDEAEADAAKYIFENDEGLAFRLTDDGRVYITQKDIRRLQLAKAAIGAGIALLIEKSRLSFGDISALKLAGGFGSKIHPETAARIGLIPQALLAVTGAVGNAAGEGAVMALLSESARAKLVNIKNKCQYIELSADKRFTQLYIDEMMFGQD